MDKLNLKNLVEKTRKLNILYVEDNEETRIQAIKILSNFLDNIDIAIDGIDGLNQYKEKDTNYYDLIISDINMPNMNGMDMAEAIFKINRHQNILMITAYNNPEYLQELINIGIKNYIHKPVRMDSLINEFQKIVDALDQRDEEDLEFNEITKLNHELDALVDSFDTYVIASRTDLKGNITYVSKAYEIISGYKESELIGKPHNIVRHPDMPSSAFKDMWTTIKSKKLWIGEVKNLKKDGGFYWVEAHIVPYYSSDGSHIGYSAIRLNITSKKQAESLNDEITNLLNNAGQGFLSFGANLEINESFSKECLSIFQTTTLYKKDISNLLFLDNIEKKDLFIEGIGRIVDSTSELQKELFLSLLPKEHNINNKIIKIEYKILNDNSFMIVLTDITKTKELESKIKKQNQIQQMIVSVASNKIDFIELKNDFDNFLINPSKSINTFQRELHTFKGIFVQKDMLDTSNAIHNLESKIKMILSLNNESNLNMQDLMQDSNIKDCYDSDLNKINSILGNDFIIDNNVSINKDSFEDFKNKLKKLSINTENHIFTELMNDVERFEDETIYKLLNGYKIVVKNLSKKLDKEIYPLEIIGDTKLKISSKYKPFIKSLIHVFNNCVDHGIEDIEGRLKNKKDEIGTIECSFEKINNNLQIIIGDDGQGINVDKLVDYAIKSNTELINLKDEEKIALIFSDNLSTKDSITLVSGRGVGMNSIKGEIDKIGGSIKIRNKIGYGVKFIFTLPL